MRHHLSVGIYRELAISELSDKPRRRQIFVCEERHCAIGADCAYVVRSTSTAIQYFPPGCRHRRHRRHPLRFVGAAAARVQRCNGPPAAAQAPCNFAVEITNVCPHSRALPHKGSSDHDSRLPLAQLVWRPPSRRARADLSLRVYGQIPGIATCITRRRRGCHYTARTTSTGTAMRYPAAPYHAMHSHGTSTTRRIDRLRVVRRPPPCWPPRAAYVYRMHVVCSGYRVATQHARRSARRRRSARPPVVACYTSILHYCSICTVRLRGTTRCCSAARLAYIRIPTAYLYMHAVDPYYTEPQVQIELNNCVYVHACAVTDQTCTN